MRGRISVSSSLDFVFLIISTFSFPANTGNACISCGRCAVSCLTHNIKLKNGKPVWGDNCVHCMKCICDCPEGAIEYGKASLGKPRYHCPDMGD